MNLKCKINDEEHPIVQGVPFSEEYNEVLDSGTIKISHTYKIEELRPYDDVIIWDADYEYLGYNEDGEPLFEGYTFESWDVLSGFPVYQEGKTIFFKHLLVDSFSYEILNLSGNSDKQTIYQYDISLFSETKGLEVVQLPNLSITEPLKMSKKKSVWEYMNKYIELYSPKYKRKKKIEDGSYSIFEWEFINKYKLHSSLKEYFSDSYSPDFDLTGANLKDLLSKLMIVKDMIPYVKNGVIYAIDQTQRNGSFDDNPKCVNSIIGNMSSSNYCDSLRTTYSEAISDNSSCRYIENLGFRNSQQVLMTLENMRLETQFPIYKINSLKMCYYKKYSIYYGFEKIKEKTFLCKQDITPLVKLNTERNLLSQDWKKFNKLKQSAPLKDLAQFKMMTIGYDIGSKTIDGWGTKYKYPVGIVKWDKSASYIENIFKILDRQNPVGELSVQDLLEKDGYKLEDGYYIIFEDEGLDGIVTPFEPKFDVAQITNSIFDSDSFLGQHLQFGAERLKSFVFQIDYQGFYNGAVVHSKDIGRDDIVINNNPNSGLTMLEKDGLYQKEQLNRFGNEVVIIKARYDDISQLQPLGSVYGDDVIIYHREYTIYDKFIQAQYIGSKDYVLKNYYTSVYAKHRTWSLMSYNEAVTRAENKKIFINLDKDESYYELNNDRMFMMQKFENTTPLKYILSFIEENKDINNSVVNLGYISHGGNLYLVNTNIFVNGYSLCFNLTMPDSISAGMYISDSQPDMDQDLDIKNTFVDKIGDFLDLDIGKMYRFLLMWDVKDDYTGSIQEWYPLIDDTETGFTEKMGFYLAKDANDILLNNKILDGNQENKVKNEIYNRLFLYPKLTAMFNFNSLKSTYYNRDNVKFDVSKFINNDLINDNPQDEYIFSTRLAENINEISLNYKKSDALRTENEQIELIIQDETKFKNYLNKNNGSFVLYYCSNSINENNDGFWKSEKDTIDASVNKLFWENIVDVNEEKLRTLNNELGFNTIKVWYTGDTEETKTWFLTHSCNAKDLYTIATKNYDIIEYVFGFNVSYTLSKNEIARLLYTVTKIGEKVDLSNFGLTLNGVPYYGEQIQASIPYLNFIKLENDTEIEDFEDFGIYLSMDNNDQKYLTPGETIVISKTEDLNFSNIIGNEYEIWKDNKEKIDMTYQIEPITNDKDILFSHWFMKLSDLNNHYKKIPNSVENVYDILTYDGSLELYYSTFQQKVDKFSNPRYPTIYLKISKNYFENQLMIGKFNSVLNYFIPWPDNFDDKRIALTGYRDYVTKSRIKIKEITEIDKINKQVTFIADEEIGYYDAKDWKTKKRENVYRKVILDREYEQDGVIYYGGVLIFEDYGPNTDSTFGISNIGALRIDIRYIASNGYKISNNDQIYLNSNFCKVSFSSISKPTIVTKIEKLNKNMYVCTSNDKMKNTLVYDKYAFAEEYFEYNSYEISNIVKYNEKLYKCIKETGNCSFDDECWEEIGLNTYIKDGHLYKIGYTLEDWNKIDLNLTNLSVSDVFKTEVDSLGRGYIYVDLTNIEGDSVQYWYVNGDTLEFVFGVNLNEKDKQRGYVKIYTSMLSSRDKRVYDENHNLIGKVWNYANKDNFINGIGQYYETDKTFDDYRQISLSLNENVEYIMYVDGEVVNADLESAYLGKINSHIKIEFYAKEKTFVNKIYINDNQVFNGPEKNTSIEFVLDDYKLIKVDTKIDEYSLNIVDDYYAVRSVIRTSSPIAFDKTNEILFSNTWNYKEFKGSKVNYGDIISIEKTPSTSSSRYSYTVLSGLDENNSVIGDVIISGRDTDSFKYYNDLLNNPGLESFKAYKYLNELGWIELDDTDKIYEGDKIYFEAVPAEGYEVEIENTKDNPLIITNKDIYASKYIKITSISSGVTQSKVTIENLVANTPYFWGQIRDESGKIVAGWDATTFETLLDINKEYQCEIQYAYYDDNIKNSMVSGVDMIVDNHTSNHAYEDRFDSNSSVGKFWYGIRFHFALEESDKKFTIKGKDN